ncbi:MAG: hypothetical protein PHT19_08595 [Methylococcus sp.]|nr:hypothetical protein [Methylococcus sp.]
MRKFCICAGLLLAMPAWPAEPSAGQTATAAESLGVQRKRLIEEGLQLTPAEARGFWPVYDRFGQDLEAWYRKEADLAAEFGENYEAMPDDAARGLLERMLALEEERLRLTKSYLPHFGRVLPPKKVVRFYQLDARIRAAVSASETAALPLSQ